MTLRTLSRLLGCTSIAWALALPLAALAVPDDAQLGISRGPGSDLLAGTVPSPSDIAIRRSERDFLCALPSLCEFYGHPNALVEEGPPLELRFLREWLEGAPAVGKNLQEWQSNGLNTGRVEREPWSGPQWPVSRGQLGQRYQGRLAFGDRERPWTQWLESVSLGPDSFESVAQSRSPQNWAWLAPAEKYDLLLGFEASRDVVFFWRVLGDHVGGWWRQLWPRGHLTPGQWWEGLQVFNRSGGIPARSDLRLGWAAAAQVYAEPTGPVLARAGDGSLLVPFAADDIKGLASLLFRRRASEKLVFGANCVESSEFLDRQALRSQHWPCQELPVHLWHVLLVARIGGARRTLVIDSLVHPHLRHQLVVAYTFDYLDPATGARSSDWRAVAWYPEDLVRPSARVAVVLELETILPSAGPGQPARRGRHALRYLLDVDPGGRPFDGVWLSPAPDLVWAVPESVARWRSYRLPEDAAVGGANWTIPEALPAVWQQWARRAAHQQRAPLAGIVDALIQASQFAPQTREPEH